jgi:hypothetical protein
MVKPPESDSRAAQRVQRLRRVSDRWHMIMEFEPSLVGCYVWSENHSFDMIRESKECVINVLSSGCRRSAGAARLGVIG